MRLAIVVVMLGVLSAACGYAPCPEHSTLADAGLCECVCGWTTGADGGCNTVESFDACAVPVQTQDQ